MRARALILTLALAAGSAAAQAPSPGWSDLPDWSGDWVMQPAKADPAPAYKPEWAAKPAGKDPFATCGLPAGTPRMMSLPGVHEFIVRPGQVWHAAETGNTVQRIYTDGRPHRAGKNAFDNWTGDSVGHWEGDTLVVETNHIKGDEMIDRSGAMLSNKATVQERIHRRDEATMEDDFVITDPVALTAPWIVTRLYRKVKGAMFDYGCAENPRNRIDPATGKTLTLDAQGNVIDAR